MYNLGYWFRLMSWELVLVFVLFFFGIGIGICICIRIVSSLTRFCIWYTNQQTSI